MFILPVCKCVSAVRSYAVVTEVGSGVDVIVTVVVVVVVVVVAVVIVVVSAANWITLFLWGDKREFLV